MSSANLKRWGVSGDFRATPNYMNIMNMSENNDQFLCTCRYRMHKFAQILLKSMMYHHLAVRR